VPITHASTLIVRLPAIVAPSSMRSTVGRKAVLPSV
jgi:hypothetical protein